MTITKRVFSGLAAMAIAMGSMTLPVLATTTDGTVVSEAAVAEVTPANEATSPVATNGIENWPQAADINSTAGIVMDADTGAILYSKNMDQQMYPASVTKVMTCLIALNNAEDLDAQVTMTETGVAYAVSGSANLYTQVGEVFTLRDMLYGMMLASANDISTQIAEYVGGSVDEFVAMMNEEAARLGCKNTHFHNACGMPDEEHWTSAYDLALIGQEALKNDLFREIVSTPSYTIPATNLTASRNFGNHHPFLVNPDYPYEGIIGGKTGYTDAAGNTLITFTERDGVTLICVTLQANGMDPELQDHKALLDYAYDNFTHIEAEAKNGSEITSGGLLTVPNNVTAEDITVSLSSDGNASWKYNDHEVGTGTMIEVEVESEVSSVSTNESEEGSLSENAISENSVSNQNNDTYTILGFTMDANYAMAFVVLGGLILIGVLAIIVTLIVKK